MSTRNPVWRRADAYKKKLYFSLSEWRFYCLMPHYVCLSKTHMEMVYTVTRKTQYVTREHLHSTTNQVWRARPNSNLACACECKRVKVSTVQFENSRVGNDSGPLHSPWLSQHLWEGNLEGCYWNESQEGPILKDTHIETDSAESDKSSSDQI